MIGDISKQKKGEQKKALKIMSDILVILVKKK